MKYILLIFVLIIGILAGVFMVKQFPDLFPWVAPEPIIKTVVKTEPGKIIYKKVPDPVIIEKVIYKDGQLSFNQDVPYEGKLIKTDIADMVFNGVYHVDVTENKLSVIDEITGDVQTTIRYKEKAPAMNEIGVLYGSLGGAGGYYKRYFNKIYIFEPWISAAVTSQDVSVTGGIAVRF